LAVRTCAVREVFSAIAAPAANSDKMARLLAQQNAYNFCLPKFIHPKRGRIAKGSSSNSSGRNIGTARLTASREPREGYREDRPEVFTARFMFA
jgi:hypothetical protein